MFGGKSDRKKSKLKATPGLNVSVYANSVLLVFWSTSEFMQVFTPPQMNQSFQANELAFE